MEAVRKTEFVIVDVETTGLSPSNGDRIIEIAALKVRDLKPVEEFHSLVNPQREISWGAYMVNGISQQMLQGAPTSDDIMPQLLEFVGDAHLIGHNIRFDLGFIRHELALLGLQFKETISVLDTIRLAKSLMPWMGRYPLANVAYSLGIETIQEHRALADVKMTFEVFRQLVAAAERRDMNDLNSFIECYDGKTCRRKKLKRSDDLRTV